jgi:hypothetical protein
MQEAKKGVRSVKGVRNITSRLGGRLLGALICLSLFGAPASSAFALDKSQIIQMSKLGLDERAIRGAIDSAGDELSLTEDDVAELRRQGVSENVIAHLERRGHVRGSAPAPPAPPVPGGGNIGMAPAPAPAPGSGETDEDREERERQEAERQAEIDRRADELNRQRAEQQARQQRIASQAGQLPRAQTALRNGNNMQAARIYLEFLSLDPAQDSPEWYDATFGMAKALYQEGILSGATTPLLEILMAGPDKPHFEEGFGMLRELTQRIGYKPPILEELTRFYIGDKSSRFQNVFNYYMGKFFFDYNRTDLALEYLQKVERGAPDYPEALYLSGVAQLDPAVNDVAGALRNFERAILAGEAEPGGNADILQLGYLALARTFYEVYLFDVALFYYQKIPKTSARNANAIFEQAWTYFMKNDFQRALGTFQTLHTPYYSNWYFPDLYILEATVYLNLCKFPQSQRALAQFREEYLDKRPILEAYLNETTDPVAYWEMMQAAYRKGANPNRQPLPRIFTNAVLEHLSFYNNHKIVRALQLEKAALEANIASLGEYGQLVLDRVNEQLETKIQEAGIMIQQRLTAVDQELQQWEIMALQIAFDIDSEEREQLQQRLLNPGWEPPVVEAGTTLMIVADDWQPWPFEGEYWLDEVTSYRSRLRTECVEK